MRNHLLEDIKEYAYKSGKAKYDSDMDYIIRYIRIIELTDMANEPPIKSFIFKRQDVIATMIKNFNAVYL